MGFAAEITQQKDRLFLWVPVAFAAGIACYFALPLEPAPYITLPFFAVLLPALYHAHRRHHDTLPWFFAFLAIAALFLAGMGFGAAQIGTQRYGTPIIPKSTGAAEVMGTVESAEDLGAGKGWRIVLTHVSIEDIAPENTPRKIRLTFKKGGELTAGQTIKTLASIDPPSGAVAPGAYDFRRHLFFEGIGGVGFSYTAPTIVETNAQAQSYLFESLREGINARIRAAAGNTSGGIMTALITGERGAISEEDNDAMRASGLYHLLSISGTHVGLVAGVLFFFSRFLMALFPWVAIHWPIKKIAAIIALCGTAFYVLLAGADVPAQRSLLMTGLVMVAILLDRSPLSLRLIAFSMLVVLAIAPHALIGVSFQMSYAAVAALICFFDYIRRWWMAWYARANFAAKAGMYLAGIMMTSVIAGGITGLFSLYHFQSFALYGVAANMIAVPITAFVIMPAAVVSMILMPIGMEALPLHAMESGTIWMLSVAHWFAGVEGAVIHVRQWPGVTFAAIVCGMVLFLLWRGWRGKVAGLAIISAGLLIVPFTPSPDILVSDSGKLFGLYQNGQLHVSSGRREKFVSENWMRLLGLEEGKPPSFASKDAPLQCDADACRIEMKQNKISFIKTQGALREDCVWADIVIAPFPVERRRCGAAHVLSLFDAFRRGAQTVYLNQGMAPRIHTTQDGKKRPWKL